jgi:stage III sporulation protein AA
MTQSSLYAAEEEMKHGFLTLPGGHRVGIVGEAVLNNGELQTLKHISGLNVRIAQEIQGRAVQVLPKLIRADGLLYHTLILSPPRAGKTTLLRDLIRNLSDGNPVLNLRGQTVGVVDERGELAGMWQGIPAYNLGCRTDVLDGCPKRMGISILVRSMSPSIIAVDELGHPQDVEAVLDALRTGVSILSTAHASTLEEAMERPSLKELFAFGVFERVIVLSRRQGPGTVETICDLKRSIQSSG